MGRRTRVWHTVQASKAEALLAVEFYNTTGERRSLEAFVVHMHLAWLYLLHAEFVRDDVDFRYWETRPDGRRCLVRVDGDPKTWELAHCARERWPKDNDPVRRNLEFFIGLRNRIEHRHQEAIGMAVAGHAQAMILNYENELVAAFGSDEGLADRLRFPVFVSSITPEGVEAVKRLRAKLPARTLRYINDFHEGLDATVAEDSRFEFRVHLVPHWDRSPRPISRSTSSRSRISTRASTRLSRDWERPASLRSRSNVSRFRTWAGSSLRRSWTVSRPKFQDSTCPITRGRGGDTP